MTVLSTHSELDREEDAAHVHIIFNFQDADHGFLTHFLTETILRIGFNAADYMSKQLESFLKRHLTPSLDH